MDFGSLLGLIRDENPLLGGDLDLGVWGDRVSFDGLEKLRDLGYDTLIRQVRGIPVSLKITRPDLEAPADLHLYRNTLPDSPIAWTGTGYMDHRIPWFIRGAITRAYRMMGDNVAEQGIQPYKPILWLVDASYLGFGATFKEWPVPTDPYGLIQRHYGDDWEYPNIDPWVWYQDHHSSTTNKLIVNQILKRARAQTE